LNIKNILAFFLSITITSVVQAWPDKPVKIVVPLSPGGGNDLITRVVAQELESIWGQPVVVENRPGGQTTIGATYVARSDPNGYTLLSAQPNILASSSVLIDNVQYDWQKDLVAVGFLGAAPPFVLAVNAKLGINTIQDLVNYSRERGFTYASAGTGGPFHIYGALLAQSLGVKGIHVPYKAAPPAVNDVLNGSVDLIFSPPAQVVQFIKSKQLVALAVVGDRRYDALPEVPAIASLNIKNFPNLHTTYAVFAPGSIPESVKQKITVDIAKAYQRAIPKLLERQLIDADSPVPSNVAIRARTDQEIWVRLTQQVAK
jgi:tripartite-type tricarboxylate transporter receptor subunit TctC